MLPHQQKQANKQAGKKKKNTSKNLRLEMKIL